MANALAAAGYPADQVAPVLRQRYPKLNLHVAEGCKHLVPWDAEDMFHRLAIPLLTGRPS